MLQLLVWKLSSLLIIDDLYSLKSPDLCPKEKKWRYKKKDRICKLDCMKWHLSRKMLHKLTILSNQ